MKPYTLKPTKKQLKVMKLFWAMLQQEQIIFYDKVSKLEDDMSERTRINALEFFMSDNEFVGIGNRERNMKLYQREELEKK
jgi:hypothetical protein